MIKYDDISLEARKASGEDIFDRLNPKDGYHVVELDLKMSLSLHGQVYGDGELYNMADRGEATRQIVEWMGPTPENRGECTRLRLVLDSICRYMTTGGSWAELTESIRRLNAVMPNGLAFPGYYLHDSYSTTNGTYQHVFVKIGTTEAVLWEEPVPTENGSMVGGFIDRTDLKTIQEQQENDETIWGETEETEEADEVGDTDTVSLPRIGDLRVEEKAHGATQ